MARGEASCPRLARQLVHKPADSGGLRIVYGGNLGCGGGNGFPIRWLDPVVAFQPGGGERIDVGGDVRCYATLLFQPGKGLLGRDPALAAIGPAAAARRLASASRASKADALARGGNQRCSRSCQGGSTAPAATVSGIGTRGSMASAGRGARLGSCAEGAEQAANGSMANRGRR
jgi:hypothetical protein